MAVAPFVNSGGGVSPLSLRSAESLEKRGNAAQRFFLAQIGSMLGSGALAAKYVVRNRPGLTETLPTTHSRLAATSTKLFSAFLRRGRPIELASKRGSESSSAWMVDYSSLCQNFASETPGGC